MSQIAAPEIERQIPSLKDAAVFRFKTTLLKGRRLTSDLLDRRLVRHPLFPGRNGLPLVGRSVSTLWNETDPRERELIAGKIQNLRIAVAEMNGVSVGAGEVFSFWKQVGRATRRRGFVEGRELREGCLIPAVGGGLCQLSNALYDAALQAGFEIVERHAHTRVVPGSLSELGRDATVFWNYVDLRFRSASEFHIEARLTDRELIVELHGEKTSLPTLHQIARMAEPATGGCETCEVGDCRNVIPSTPAKREFGRQAFLLDESTPEFAAYLGQAATRGDLVCIPIDGVRFRKPNYAWPKPAGAEIKQSLLITAKRSIASRRLAAQGARRQAKLLEMSEELARGYTRKLSADVLHVTVHQNLLPYLWRQGVFGGRTFDVLMTALPMREIQARLDQAFSLHSESRTLADFRADASLLAAEADALAAARRIITPHSLIASLFAERSEKLAWSMPQAVRRAGPPEGKKTILFPATTVGRKGCYELRKAVRDLDVKILTMGPSIESPDFWSGFDVGPAGDDVWSGPLDAVVLPAFIEHKPRRLLRAAAVGIPVIASDACGVDGVEGVSIVPAGDAAQLRAHIERSLG